ncbi:isochorismatase family protein [Apiospora arundinis]
MKSVHSARTALIVIDVQNGFLDPSNWGTERSTPESETNITRLLAAARAHNANLPQGGKDVPVLVCHVHHHSVTPSSNFYPDKTIEVEGEAVPRRAVDAQPFAAPGPGETIWVKDVNSAFIGTGLEAFLRAHGVRQLVICGFTTDHCVSTSTRMAGNLRIVDEVVAGSDDKKTPTTITSEGDIVLVGDACAAYAKGGFDAETVHRVTLASLDGEFAQVAATADVIGTVFDA